MTATPVRFPYITAPPEVETYIRDHGRGIYIWPSHHRCCGGGLTLLETSTRPPSGREFDERAIGGITVYLDRSIDQWPAEVTLGLRGFRRRRVEAWWNGCAYVL